MSQQPNSGQQYQPQYQQQQQQQQYGQQPQYGHQPQYGGQQQYQQQQPQYQQQYQTSTQPQYQQNNAGYGAPPPAVAPQAGATHSGGAVSSGDAVEGTPIYPDGTDPRIQSKFVSKGARDIWAAIVFLVQIFICIAWAAYNGATVSQTIEDYDTHARKNGKQETSKDMREAISIFLPIAGIGAAILAFIAMAVMRCAPVKYIWGANIAAIALGIIFGLLCIFVFDNLFTGVILILFAIIHAVWLYCVRHRIPYAGEILKNAVMVVTRHWGTIVTSACSVLLFGLYLVFFLFACLPSFLSIAKSNANDTGSANSSSTPPPLSGGTVSPSSSDNGEEGGSPVLAFFLLMILMLLFYWTTQVIFNVVHVTSSGTVATWFFVGEPNKAMMPQNVTLHSLRRAMTTSFGSICFGSLLVAILKLIYWLANMFSQNAPEFVRCIILCIIGCIESLMRYFNVYAFTYVAIYGSSYVEAAKQTWDLIKRSIWEALINDALLGPVISITALIGSLIIGALMGFGAASVYDSSTIGYTIFFMAFLIATVVHHLILTVVYSGIVTIFVCVAEEFEVLRANNPELADAMLAALEEAKKPCCGGGGDDNSNNNQQRA